MMNRRHFLRYAQLGMITSLGAAIAPQFKGMAQSSGSLTVDWFGHSCFLFSGSGVRILVNPFKPSGCTASYRTPSISSDLVFISSRLLDEGAVEELPGNPQLLSQAGTYGPLGIPIQGILTQHDRYNGYRFGSNIAWKWKQGGLNILHLGGIASPIEIEQEILMGGSDLLFIPVGGGEKAYTPQEAKAAIEKLKPKVVVPMQYRTSAADPNACDLKGVEDFLSIMQGTVISRTGQQTLTFSTASLPSSTPTIQVMSA